jgi:hypothetical protein
MKQLRRRPKRSFDTTTQSARKRRVIELAAVRFLK